MTEQKPKIRRSTAAPVKTRDDQVIDRRRSLLKAAVKVISKRGLTGVTINSMAAEAECSYGVVAFHFQSKEGIIFAALDYTAAEYEAFLAKLNASERSPAERIRHMIDTDFSRKAAGRIPSRSGWPSGPRRRGCRISANAARRSGCITMRR